MSEKSMIESILRDADVDLRSFREPVLYTNLLFLVNSLFWYAAGHSGIALVVMLTGFASIGYHLPRESMKLTHDVDVCCAHIALLCTLYAIYPFASAFQWMLLISILGAGLYTKTLARRQNYEYWHTIWHVFVFLGQALMAYIAFT
jgi:predicted membrane channel-forming protein YqfA (hemolysin III family)